jgi:ribonuclease HI
LAKINVLAAMSKNSGQAAAAAVARDEDGDYLGASVLVEVWQSDPEAMEAMACREGLALASDLGLHSFRVVSDCANAVRSLLGEGFDSFGPIVREINVRRRNFTRADFVFKGRKSNVNAHILARSSVNLSTSRHVWFLEPPNEVCNSYPTE